jgi:hypothetical protein
MTLRTLALLGACLAALPLPAAEPPAVKPVNLDRLNTGADEEDPYAASATLLYFASNAAGKFDLLASRRANARTPWPAGKPLEGYLATEADDRGVCATAEGSFPQFLYYATQRDKRQGNFDLYVAVRQFAGREFTAPTPLQEVCTPEDEMHPWLTADKRRLYFSRKTKEGWRVFAASRPSPQGPRGFQAPAPVEGLPPDLHHATLTPDGKTMYLQGPVEGGRWGLFRSRSAGTGWSRPEPLEGLNHPEGPKGSVSPSLSRDGALLYFASDRPGGKGGLDLWVVPAAQLNRPK